MTPAPRGLTLETTISAAAWETALADPEGLADRCAAAASALAADLRGEASLLLADDDALQALNRDFRGKDRPTNVLSFPAAAPFRPFLGDIAVSLETATREAAEKGVSLGDHAAHLIVHGLLHLIGYDHETDDDATVMETLETRILATLGVADPYRSEAEQ